MKKILLLTLLLAACRHEQVAEVEDACGAAPLQDLIGQPASATEALDLTDSSRILAHNALATTDFRPDRLNIVLAGDGTIDRVYCG